MLKKVHVDSIGIFVSVSGEIKMDEKFWIFLIDLNKRELNLNQIQKEIDSIHQFSFQL